MKILIFNWRDIKNPKAGGAEVVIHENAKRWVRAGHEVTILAGGFKGCKGKEKLDSIEIFRTGEWYSLYWKAKRYYNKYLKENVDVVVEAINTIPFFTPLYVHKPIISLIFQFTKDIYFKFLPRFVAYFPYYLEPFILKLYKKCPVVVLSESIKKELITTGFDKNSVFVIEPGINHHEDLIGKRKTEYPSMLYLNRIVNYKNPDHVILAFKKVKKEIPQAKLIMAGFRSNNSYERKIKSLARELKLVEDVQFYKFVNGQEKIELLQSAWVHILPSIREGWGLSVVEAAAYGIPTVGYDVVGLRDSVRDGITGLLVPSGNINALANSIINIITDNALRNELGRNALEYARRFDWDKSSEKFLKLIEGMFSNE